MLDHIINLMCRHPDQLVRGVVSALAACDADQFPTIAQRWSQVDAAPAAQVAVLRATALREGVAVIQLKNLLPTYLQSQNSHIRAAACRACAVACQPASIIPLLREALSDPDLQVRAEASIALGKLADAEAACPVLLQSVLMQASLYSGATGAIRAQASRRLQRWARELACLMPIGAPEARDMLAQLPPRIALTFALWHGDLAHLPFVIDQLADEDVGRYAGWVWQTLTGIDLTASGLALPEPDPASLDPDQLITETRLDADSGHPQADQAAVRAATAASPHLVGRGKRVLLGREIDAKTALDLLENAPQAIRAMAAQI
ncbi:HEAT repeat domain-containing protein, partial [Massilia sp. CCM 8734]|uniref:HEAT repeat domain-containing protein n=1 Tax=Massilia sp. CCM 8734 TaxID=2609283 RepID=UPI001422D423